jgi:hypothetical protein
MEVAMAARIFASVLGFFLGVSAIGAIGTGTLSGPYSNYRQAVAAADSSAYGEFRTGLIELKHLP